MHWKYFRNAGREESLQFLRGSKANGLYTAEAIASRRWLRQQIRQVRALTKTLRNV
jgi:hypothetical protein